MPAVLKKRERDIAIANQHRRLRLNRRAVQAAIALLDGAFKYSAADLPFLSSAGKKRAQAQLRISSDNSSTGDPSAAPAGELSLVFLSDADLAALHGQFLDDPTTTDVITFEGDPLAETAGEICVSVDTAARYAEAHGRVFSEELTLYLVHGWLHLAGYDDLKPAKKRRMRAAEARAMSLLKAANAVPSFQLRA